MIAKILQPATQKVHFIVEMDTKYRTKKPRILTETISTDLPKVVAKMVRFNLAEDWPSTKFYNVVSIG